MFFVMEMACFAPSLRPLIHFTVGFQRHSETALVHGMREEIAQDLVENPLTHRVLAAGQDDGVRTAAVVFNVDVGEEPARIAVGWL